MTESRIGAEELRRLVVEGRPLTILDVRGSAAFRAGGERVRGDLRVMAREVATIADRLDRDSWILAYCTCLDDGLAVRAAERLQGLGFPNARAVVGGLEGCAEGGLELAPKEWAE